MWYSAHFKHLTHNFICTSANNDTTLRTRHAKSDLLWWLLGSPVIPSVVLVSTIPITPPIVVSVPPASSTHRSTASICVSSMNTVDQLFDAQPSLKQFLKNISRTCTTETICYEYDYMRKYNIKMSPPVQPAVVCQKGNIAFHRALLLWPAGIAL